MWALRILSGPHAGTVIELKEGVNSVGRTSQSDVTIPSGGVSKNHAKISISGNQIRLQDMGSSNGTFANGVKVKTHTIAPGDKIAFHDVMVEVVQAPLAKRQIHPQAAHQAHAPLPQQIHSQEAYETHDNQLSVAAADDSIKARVDEYLEDVVLPGVYKLPEWFEFKYVLGMFVMAFILFVTSLSAIPMMRILKDSIQTESQNRARTIASNLAAINKQAIVNGVESSINVVRAVNEPGVDSAYIIAAADGRIMAPARDAGGRLTVTYVNEGRKLGRESVSQVDDSTIVAMHPVTAFNPTTNLNSVMAFSVVVYNMGALAVDGDRVLSLFIQTFLIALFIGGILFFFLFKMIEYPIRVLNSQMDEALKSGNANVEVKYLFPSLQNLATNINSTLNRALHGGGVGHGPAPEKDRFNEMTNIVNMVGYAALAIHAVDSNVVAANNAFFDRTGLQPHDVLNSSVDALLDQALKLSIQDLVSRVLMDPEQLATNDLEFSGENFQLTAQAVFGTENVSYVVVALLPLVESEAQYA